METEESRELFNEICGHRVTEDGIMQYQLPSVTQSGGATMKWFPSQDVAPSAIAVYETARLGIPVNAKAKKAKKVRNSSAPKERDDLDIYRERRERVE